VKPKALGSFFEQLEAGVDRSRGPLLAIRVPVGDHVMSISPTGVVTFGEGVTPSETALAFADALPQVFGAKDQRIAELEVEIAEMRKARADLAAAANEILTFPFGVMTDDTYCSFVGAIELLRRSIDAAIERKV
jgi:hypothetical protein